jgi:hypothetical protein
LATLEDVFTREVVGWEVSVRHNTDLVAQALLNGLLKGKAFFSEVSQKNIALICPLEQRLRPETMSDTSFARKNLKQIFKARI